MVINPGVALGIHFNIKEAVRGYLLQFTLSSGQSVTELTETHRATELKQSCRNTLTSSMWSRKGMPVCASHLPVPSRFMLTLTRVSLVLRSTTATLSAQVEGRREDSC